MNNIKVDIIIISYNTSELTLNCIKSVYETAYNIISDIIVVDNNSIDDSVKKIEGTFPEVKIIVNPENYGYAKAVNIGVKESSSNYLIISNPDVIYHSESIQTLIKTIANNNNVGVAGPRQLYPDGKNQRSFGNLPSIKLGLMDFFLITHLKEFLTKKKPPSSIKEVEYIDGAVIAFKKENFEKVNGFDEDYFFYTEEADFCFKVRNLGLKNLHVPNAMVTHLRGATDLKKGVDGRRINMLISSKTLFCKKNLSFQSAKFFMIFEILYSLNMMLIWHVIGIFNSKAKIKNRTFSYFYKSWISEFDKYLKNEK